jgi:putative DNA primase/helicase
MTAPAIATPLLNIPEDLRALAQWVTWRALPNAQGELAKIPHIAGSNQRASTTNPGTWVDFGTALSRLTEQDAGLGFVFTKEAGIVGVDLDDVRNAQTGEVVAWARRIVERVGSYAKYLHRVRAFTFWHAARSHPVQENPAS